MVVGGRMAILPALSCHHDRAAQLQVRTLFKAGLVALFIFSLLWCAVKTQQDQTAAFYRLGTRGWEFLAGGMVYYFNKYCPKKKYFEYIGILLNSLAVFFYSDGLKYPGCWGLLPVAGAGAVIGAESVVGGRPIRSCSSLV